MPQPLHDGRQELPEYGQRPSSVVSVAQRSAAKSRGRSHAAGRWPAAHGMGSKDTGGAGRAAGSGNALPDPACSRRRFALDVLKANVHVVGQARSSRWPFSRVSRESAASMPSMSLSRKRGNPRGVVFHMRAVASSMAAPRPTMPGNVFGAGALCRAPARRRQ